MKYVTSLESNLAEYVSTIHPKCKYVGCEFRMANTVTIFIRKTGKNLSLFSTLLVCEERFVPKR